MTDKTKNKEKTFEEILTERQNEVIKQITANKCARLILAETDLSQARKELKQLKIKLIEYDDALDTIKHLCTKHNSGEKIVFAQEILDIINKIKGGE